MGRIGRRVLPAESGREADMGKSQGVRAMVAGGGQWPGTPGKLAAGALLYSDTRGKLVETGNLVDATRRAVASPPHAFAGGARERRSRAVQCGVPL